MGRARSFKTLASLSAGVGLTVLLVAGLSQPATAGTGQLVRRDGGHLTKALNEGSRGFTELPDGRVLAKVNTEPARVHVQLNGSLPPTVLYYPFDGETDQATDGSGNGYDGTIYGDPVTDSVGICNEAFAFDGVDDYVSATLPTDLYTWTVSTWVYANRTPDGSRVAHMVQRNQNFVLNWDHSEPKYLGTAAFKHTGEGDWVTATLGIDPDQDVGRWVHLAATWDGQDLRAYKDCELQGVYTPITPGVPSFDTEFFKVGRSNDPSGFFSGTIDEVRVWSTTLDADAIAEMCQAQVSGMKYEDQDRDGVKGGGDDDPFIQNWWFTLTNASGSVVGSVQTDVDGRAAFGTEDFAEVVAGQAYTLCEALPYPWVNTEPGGGVPGPGEVCTNTGILAPYVPCGESQFWFGNYDLSAIELAITKMDGTTEVMSGQTITYTITVDNPGDTDASGVVVTDTLPDWTTLVGPSSWQQVGSTREYTVSVGPLLAGYTETLTLSVTLSDTVPPSVAFITNTVEVADDGLAGADDNDVDAVTAARDLSIGKSDGVSTVAPGDTLTYTITITNAGHETATGVLVTDTLPVSTSYVGGTPAWLRVGASQAYTATVDMVPGGDTETLTLTVTLTDPVPAGLEVITNRVEVADDGGAGYLVYASDTDVDTVEASPDLAITKTDGITIAVPGDTITYTITISNVGTQDASGVVVTDTLPPTSTATFVEASDSGIHAGGVVEWPSFDLAVGVWTTRTVTVEITDTIPAGVDALTNTVTVSDDGTSGADANPNDNTAHDVNQLGAYPDLFLAKSADAPTTTAGALVLYTLSWGNGGTRGAAGVVITDTVPANTAFDADASDSGWEQVDATDWYTFGVGSVPVGVTGTVTFAVMVDDAIPAGVETITNTASIVDDGTNGEDPNALDNLAEEVVQVLAAPDLVLEKTDGQAAVVPGQTLTYTLTISNAGTQGATGVVVTDTLPAHTGFLTASHGGIFSDSVVSWPLFDLAAGADVTRSVSAWLPGTLPAEVEAITNTASVADDGHNGDDLNPLDNVAEDVDVIATGPDLVLAKTDGQTEVQPGGILTYTVTVTNTGPQTATGVILCDLVPTDTTFLAASDGALFSDPMVTWPLFDLNVGEAASRTVTVRVTTTIPTELQVITNTALVCDDGSGGRDPVPEDNTAVDWTYLSPHQVYLPLVSRESVAMAQEAGPAPGRRRAQGFVGLHPRYP